MLIFSYAIVGVAKANADLNYSVLLAAWAKEEPSHVLAMCGLIAPELRSLRTVGLPDGFGNTIRFRFRLTGDMKWLRMAVGLGSVASTYCCVWCDMTRDELPDSLFQPQWAKWDKDVKEMPTAMAMAARAEKWSKAGPGGVAGSVDIRNQMWPPALDIDMGDCPCEPLHLLLRITEQFEAIRIASGDEVDKKDRDNPHRSKKYMKLLRSLGVHRSITGLTGNECKKVSTRTSKARHRSMMWVMGGAGAATRASRALLFKDRR